MGSAPAEPVEPEPVAPAQSAADMYERHRSILERALEAIRTREHWTPYPESPRGYGEDAPEMGRTAFEARLGMPFDLGQPAEGRSAGSETSPYGLELGATYPKASVSTLLDASAQTMGAWAMASSLERAGVCLEILDRMSAKSFEMGHAVMQTTGQAFLMAFQAGGPHALDRGLEALAYAYREVTRLPDAVRWEKPQGRRAPLVVDKTWRIRPRGIAVTLGVSTFPTWNGYPGIFASLVTGNPVVVKPHPATIMPFAIFVETARGVLGDAGFDPNVVLLAVDTFEEPIAQDLVLDTRVGIVDYTGGAAFGTWLEENVHHAAVFTEKSGVNSVILDSAPDLRSVFRNLSASLTMYSGQMCTTPQNIYVPRDGIDIGDDHVAFDDVAGGLAEAVDGLLADDDRASDILGSIKDPATLERLASAAVGGKVLLESREVNHPMFPTATVRTPLIVGVDAADVSLYSREMFGPVAYVIATDSTEHSLELAKRSAVERGAITWLVYTTDDDVADAAENAAVEGGVSVSFNLTAGLFVNQSAAFSDFHVTGANPAGNASLSGPAFVASRFRVIGIRKSVG